MTRLRIFSLLIAIVMVICCFSGCSRIEQVIDNILDNTRNPLQEMEETLPPDTSDETQPTSEPEVPETTEATESTETEPEIATGNIGIGITSGDYVNVRTGPGTQYEVCDNLRKNTRLEILEVRGDWGRISKGWIYLDYVYMDGTYGEDPAIMGTINGTDVYIRSGPGTDYEVVGSTNTGDRYEFFYQTIIGGRRWGCTSIGWICMDYVKLDGTPATRQPGPTVPKQ